MDLAYLASQGELRMNESMQRQIADTSAAVRDLRRYKGCADNYGAAMFQIASTRLIQSISSLVKLRKDFVRCSLDIDFLDARANLATEGLNALPNPYVNGHSLVEIKKICFGEIPSESQGSLES